MELQYVFVRFGMFGVWYLLRMLVTILSLRLSLLYKSFVVNSWFLLVCLFIIKTSYGDS